MATGAVLMRTGTAKQSELGGLAGSMRWTCIFCLVGSFSVFPLNCGFVTKSLVLNSVAHEHRDNVWLVLVLAAAGAFLTAGLKVPFFAFFSPRRSSRKVDDAPLHMLVAMGISAVICLAIGMFPNVLYGLLPFEVDEQPYTVSHVVQQMQLLSGTAMIFGLLVHFGGYPQPVTGILIDFDWFYRVPAEYIRRWHAELQTRPNKLQNLLEKCLRRLEAECSDSGILGRSVSTNIMATFAIILLAIYLLVYY